MLPCMKKITCFAYVKEKHSQTVHEVEVFSSLCTAIRSPQEKLERGVCVLLLIIAFLA